MSNILETKSCMVGDNDSHQTSSKSILSTSNLGYIINIPKPEINKIELQIDLKTGFEEPIVFDMPEIVEKNSLQTTFKTGFEQNSNIVIIKPINFVEKPLLQTTFKTGFEHNDIPVVDTPEKEIKQDCHNNEDSIIKEIETGFGECNTIEKDCPKPKFKSHLYKENYLSEFKTDIEKQIARENLGVYGKSEIVAVIKTEISNQSFIEKEEVQQMIANLNLIDSTLKAVADYQIPNTLFKL